MAKVPDFADTKAAYKDATRQQLFEAIHDWQLKEAQARREVKQKHKIIMELLEVLKEYRCTEGADQDESPGGKS